MQAINVEKLAQLVASVRRSPKYAQIAPTLVERIAREELEKRTDFAECTKAVRSRLHQLTGAYLPAKIDYAQWSILFRDPTQDKLGLCRRILRLHASTAERLPFLEDFYTTCLASIRPLHSVLDLACGLNPLALPWMPLAEDCTYLACDVLQPMIDFLNEYFKGYTINGQAFPCDLTSCIPDQSVQVAFLLKTLPLMDQIDKTLSRRLLEGIKAEHILVSYPAKSLGGKSKGMPTTYSTAFYRLIEGLNFKVEAFTFPTEIAFLLTR
jgi:16S rRNA (guanine(1405)-N(7))-methyltransferase